jgi:hypothetical protein
MSSKAYTFEHLNSAVARHTAVTVKKTRSGSAIFTEYGARLLGLFPDKSLPNVLWNPEKIGESVAEKKWGIGGERLWISPERNFYYENPRDFEGHHVPPGMDPGRYVTTGALKYRNSFSVFDYVKNQAYDDCSAERMFAMIDDPYKTKLDYAGVRIVDSMIIGVPHFPMCCWSLGMVYTCGTERPGTAFFPIKKGATFLSYFNKIPAHRAEPLVDYVRFRIDASEIYKLAIAPEDIDTANPCKAVYVSPYPSGKKWFCVIKRSTDLPRNQKECVDPAKGNPEGPKGAIQSYNSGPKPGEVYWPFGEIELQLSKGVTKGKSTVSKATHELLSYAGEKDEILALAQKALRIGSTPEIY